MTTEAWMMLVVTWALIAGFTAVLFVKVLRTAPRDGGDSEGEPGELDSS